MLGFSYCNQSTNSGNLLNPPGIYVPNNGPVGTVVTIHGMSLAQTTAVSFHGVRQTASP
jgi:hypothetical protein